MSIWDEPELKVVDSYAKLENVGDEISGDITDVKKHKFETGDTKPQLIFTSDATVEEMSWTAGQIQDVRKLAELRPEIGDWFKAKLTNIEKRGGGKTLKHIDIEVRRGGRNGPAAIPGAATANATADPLAGLNAEQRAAVAAAQSSEVPF